MGKTLLHCGDMAVFTAGTAARRPPATSHPTTLPSPPTKNKPPTPDPRTQPHTPHLHRTLVGGAAGGVGAEPRHLTHEVAVAAVHLRLLLPLHAQKVRQTADLLVLRVDLAVLLEKKVHQRRVLTPRCLRICIFPSKFGVKSLLTISVRLLRHLCFCCCCCCCCCGGEDSVVVVVLRRREFLMYLSR